MTKVKTKVFWFKNFERMVSILSIASIMSMNNGHNGRNGQKWRLIFFIESPAAESQFGGMMMLISRRRPVAQEHP